MYSRKGVPIGTESKGRLVEISASLVTFSSTWPSLREGLKTFSLRTYVHHTYCSSLSAHSTSKTWRNGRVANLFFGFRCHEESETELALLQSERFSSW